MNLVYLCDFDIPAPTASSVQVMRMCEAFAKQGHQVTLVTISKRKASDTSLFDYYGVESLFAIQEVFEPVRTGRLYFFSWRAGKIIHALKPDLIFSRSLLGLWRVFKHYPVMFEAHKPVWEYGMVYNFTFRQLVRSHNFKGLVAISGALKEIFRGRFPYLKIHVAHDAATKTMCNHVVNVPIMADTTCQAGYTGSILKGRGVEIIVELARRMPSVGFHIVGGTVEDIYRLGILHTPPNLVCHGYVDPSLVGCYRKQFDILLAPYQENVETIGGSLTKDYMSPLKVFEYMSEGKPIVCSDMKVLREVLNESTAILVKPDDVDQWERSIRGITERKGVHFIGENAYAEFLEHYTYDARVNSIIKFAEG